MESSQPPVQKPASPSMTSSLDNIVSPTLSTSSTPAATPKLKLTFKLADIRAADAAVKAEQGATVSTSNSNSASTSTKTATPNANTSSSIKKVKRLDEGPTSSKKGSRNNSRENLLSQQPSTSATNTSNTSVLNEIGERSKLVFPEQISFVREMQKFTSRKWRIEATAVMLLGDRQQFSVPCWVTSEKLYTTITTSQQGMPKTPSLKMTTYQSTFVCTQEGCHKIFDSKDKWRRHMNIHKRKESTTTVNNSNADEPGTGNTGVVQKLKLNVGAMKNAMAAAKYTGDTSLLTTTSEMDTQVDLLDSQMEIEN